MKRTLLSMLSLLMLSGPALADDTLFRGSGAGIYPVKSQDIKLEREVVTFVQMNERDYHVSALLVFRNTTKKPIAARVGFPDRGDFWDGDKDPTPGSGVLIRDLAVHVDGKPVKGLKATKMKGTDEHPWNRVFLFDMTFPPGRPVTVLHEYTLGVSMVADMTRFISYILTSGGHWKGAIDEAVFEFRFRTPPVGPVLRYGQKILLGAPLYSPDKRAVTRPIKDMKYSWRYTGGTEPVLTVTFQDLKPTADLELSWRADDLARQYLKLFPMRKIPGKVNLDDCLRELELYGLDRYNPSARLQACYAPEVLSDFLRIRSGWEPAMKKLKLFEKGIFLKATVPEPKPPST